MTTKKTTMMKSYDGKIERIPKWYDALVVDE